MMSAHTFSNSDKNGPKSPQAKSQQKPRYDALYKTLHWVVAVLMILMLLAKFGFASAITQDDKITMLIGHSSIGTVLTFFILLRLVKRFVIKSERPVQGISDWQKKVSHLVHMALYFCLIMIPLTGYLTANLHQLPVMPFTLFNLSQASGASFNEANFLFMRGVHETFINGLIALLVIHIGAALFHKFIKKDSVMSSMTPGK